MYVKIMGRGVRSCPPYSNILTEGVKTLTLGRKATLHFIYFPYLAKSRARVSTDINNFFTEMEFFVALPNIFKIKVI